MGRRGDAGGDTDEALMQRFRAGDVQAFETLYARHKGPLFRYLRRQCRTAAVAEELFQDVWMRVIGAKERYQVRAKFTTYLYRIAHNRLADHYRSDSRSNRVLTASLNCDESQLVDTSASADPAHRLQGEEQVVRLRMLVAQLPELQREVFLLHEDGGLSLEDIAKVLDVGRETVKSRLRYAVAKLRRGLSGET